MWGANEWVEGADRMALEGPKVSYVRKEDEPALSRALRLAREVEELLEDASITQMKTSSVTDTRDEGAHSTRIVRAMAASLVDELEAMDRGTRKSGVA